MDGILVVKRINGQSPNLEGDITINLTGNDGRDGRNGLDGRDGRNGLDGKDGKDGKDGTNGLQGPPGLTYANNPTKQLKVWTGVATVQGTNGQWNVDYSSVDFDNVVHVTATVLAGSFAQANAPLATHVISFFNVATQGKAFKVTSAGLLAAMQQTPAEPGTQILVCAIGY